MCLKMIDSGLKVATSCGNHINAYHTTHISPADIHSQIKFRYLIKSTIHYATMWHEMHLRCNSSCSLPVTVG